MAKSKKAFFVLCVVFAVLLMTAAILLPFVSISEAAYAEDVFESGYELSENYDVKINYCFYVKYINGIREAYEVYFDKNYYKALEDPKALILETKDTFVKNGFLVRADATNGSMIAERVYDTTADYYIAAGIDGYAVDEDVNKPSKKSLLFLTYEQRSKTAFQYLKSDGKYINRIYRACKNYGIEDGRMLLNYVYGTPYNEKMLTSTGKVTYSSNEKLYYHTFEIPMGNLDEEYTITRRIPNTKGWYLIAILGGVAVLAIPLAIVIRKKTEKKNGTNANQ